MAIVLKNKCSTSKTKQLQPDMDSKSNISGNLKNMCIYIYICVCVKTNYIHVFFPSNIFFKSRDRPIPGP